MSNIKPISLDHLVDLAKKTGVDKEPWANRMLYSIATTNNQDLVEAFVKRLRIPILIESLDPFPFETLDPSKMVHGDKPEDMIRLGTVKGTDIPFLYNINDLVKHGLILGGTGFGKTTLMYWIISQCMLKGINVWVWEQSKSDCRHLKRIFPNLMVFQVGKDYKWNPNQRPPGVPQNEWDTIQVGNFCKATGLMDGSENFLLPELKKLNSDWGVYNGSDICPSYHDLKERLETLSLKRYSDEDRYRCRVLNRLNGFLTTNPDMYDCYKGFSLEELSNKSVVFELSAFSEQQSRFISNLHLYWLFISRIASQQRNQGLRNVVIFDESDWALPAEFNKNLGLPPIKRFLAQSREFGIGVLAASQTTEINQAIFVNSYLKICMHMGSGEDLEKVKRDFSLDREQLDYMHRLQIGEALVRYPKIPHPFIIEIPKFPLE